jgi:DNA-binding MarR family transcriptional regulator
MSVKTENLIFTIHRTHDMLRHCEDKIFAKYGLTTEKYEVLMAINCLDAPVRPTDVALRLARSTNSVSMIVDRMVKAGLLNRVRDEGDRREVHLSITSKAITLLEPAAMASEEFILKALSQLSYGAKQDLTTILAIIQQNVKANR